MAHMPNSSKESAIRFCNNVRFDRRSVRDRLHKHALFSREIVSVFIMQIVSLRCYLGEIEYGFQPVINGHLFPMNAYLQQTNLHK